MEDRYAIVLLFDESGIDIQDWYLIKAPDRLSDANIFNWAWKHGHDKLGKEIDYKTPARVRSFSLINIGPDSNDWDNWFRYSKEYLDACNSDHPESALYLLNTD